MTPPLHSIISRLHLKQLRLLVALGEHGSLLKASQQVALTQPGASKALQEIETTFGTSLFIRTNRGLEPNEVGHCVIRYARLIQTDLAHLRDEIVGIMRGQGGRVAAGSTWRSAARPSARRRRRPCGGDLGRPVCYNQRSLAAKPTARRRLKRRIHSMLGFKSMATAEVVLTCIEMVHMMRKQQARFAYNPSLSIAEQFEILAA